MTFRFVIFVFMIGTTLSNPYWQKKTKQSSAKTIGLKIWHNECAGKIEGLLSWNPGEEFASLGICHAIWHPKKKNPTFKETFPRLVRYFKKKGISIPSWLNKEPFPPCPWNTQQEFEQARNSPKQRELAKLLESTIWLQTEFMIERLLRHFPRIIAKLPEQQQKKVFAQFERMLKTAQGTYILVDYINFKGEGINPQERYNNTGWGLIQVLELMKGTSPGYSAHKEFADKARFVLEQRIKNSPKERNEIRWLPGWNNRIATYIS